MPWCDFNDRCFKSRIIQWDADTYNGNPCDHIQTVINMCMYLVFAQNAVYSLPIYPQISMYAKMMVDDKSD